MSINMHLCIQLQVYKFTVVKWLVQRVWPVCLWFLTEPAKLPSRKAVVTYIPPSNGHFCLLFLANFRYY